jgi:catechol 2,3-dioxygenase-like lactoylglutathione lyase family enzyme
VFTRFRHWSLSVANLDRSIAFYESVLGCSRVGDARPRSPLATARALCAAELERDNQRFELIQFERTVDRPRPQPQCNHLGLSHLTVAIDSAEALIAELERRAVPVRRHTLGSFVPEPGTTEQQFLFEDPDGNLIETYAPSGPDWNVFDAAPSIGTTTSAPTGRVDRGVVQHLSHFSLCVSDPDGTRPFYEQMLGLELVAAMDWKGDGPSRVMDVGDAMLTTWLYTRDGQRIEIIYFDEPRSPRRPKPQLDDLGLSHLTFEVDDLDAAARSLRRAGVVVHDPSTHADDSWFLFEDPEGNLVQAVTRA